MSANTEEVCFYKCQMNSVIQKKRDQNKFNKQNTKNKDMPCRKVSNKKNPALKIRFISCRKIADTCQ